MRRAVTRSAVFAALAAVLAGGGYRPAGNPGPQQPGHDLRGVAGSPSQEAQRGVAAGQQPGYALAQLLGSSGAAGFHHGGGVPPKVWGMSRACANVARKSRIRRAGHGGQKQ